MKKIAGVVAVSVVFGVIVLCSGCGSLSLFSDRHVHYHASPDADKKIDDLNKRVEALEKAAQNQKK